MEINMSREDVLTEIEKLTTSGSNLKKKIIKKENPQLMRSALHYFPDWESAITYSTGRLYKF
ncbi:hypothetical protein [Bacillus sp. FJAT-45350]|uniref:hypothetical protein n=1 Tax=Bacillus sp. FJAT-45350 TaxID=2011014 RepID=UPI000BB77ACF|nr:hypothetical protein [Bacillus sp. FJAT-45350]